MREIVWDTETTGFDPSAGDRIVEIGAIELHNHMPTGNVYHQYINPQRNMPQSAYEVHGLSEEFLSNHPIFADIAADFLKFIGDSVLIAHNAEFDMRFLNAELARADLPKIPLNRSLDTLEIARKKFPGAQNSLDALCRRYNVDNSARQKHGALLDSEILAEVYLELIGGRQPDFALGHTQTNSAQHSDADQPNKAGQIKPKLRPTPLPSYLSDEERAAHRAFTAELGDKAIWNNYFGNS